MRPSSRGFSHSPSTAPKEIRRRPRARGIMSSRTAAAMATREPPKPPGLSRFFDRLLRLALSDLRLPAEGIADYLAGLLARFARTDQLYAIRDQAGRRIDSVTGLLLEAERAW